MKIGRFSVGTDAQMVTNPGNLTEGMRLLGRSANSGDVYLGVSSNVTTTTGVILPKGDPATVFPYTVPAEHFNGGGNVWLIGSAAAQIVDTSAQ